MSQNIGKVVQVIGPVIDIKFDTESLPNIYNAIEITQPKSTKKQINNKKKQKKQKKQKIK